MSWRHRQYSWREVVWSGQLKNPWLIAFIRRKEIVLLGCSGRRVLENQYTKKWSVKRSEPSSQKRDYLIFFKSQGPECDREEGWLVDLLKKAEWIDHGEKSLTNGTRQAVNVENCWNHPQTAMEDKINLQQVRKFTHKDVSFASRWAVNTNKVEAGWVELEGES